MDDLKFRDVSCRVTGVYDCCEQAHLVPASARDWWDRNMADISGFEIESAQNGILLRMDLHRLFDLGAWVPMVKENKMVVHVLRNSDISNQFIQFLHDREMQELIGIDKRCLFARIAYSVLPLLSEFLSARRLAKENTLFKIGDEVKEWTPEACKSFKIKPRSRNPSRRSDFGWNKLRKTAWLWPLYGTKTMMTRIRNMTTRQLWMAFVTTIRHAAANVNGARLGTASACRNGSVA